MLTWHPWPPASTAIAAASQIANRSQPALFNSTPFPNYDCVRLPSPTVDWDQLHASLQTVCKGHTRETGTLQCSATISNWQKSTLTFLQMHRPWEAESSLDFNAFEMVEDAARAECPLGVLMLNIAKTLLCAEAMHACYSYYTQQVSDFLFELPLAIMIGTRWPIFALLNSYDWTWPGIPQGRDYDCDMLTNRTTVEWSGLRRIFANDPQDPQRNWWLGAIRFVFDTRLAFSMYTASRECLYGLFVANIVKAMWAADTESSSYAIYAPYVSWVLYESLHFLGGTKWPMFALLHHFTSLKRHGFQLDFTAQELAGLPFRDSSQWLQEQPLERHVGLLDLFSSWRPHFASVIVALQTALSRSGASRMVYVTMVYGNFNKYIHGWARRLKRIGVKNLVMAALDAEAYQLCREHHGEQCVTGSISAMNKYTLLLVALQLGIDVMWLDFDIFLVKDPTPSILEAAKAADLLISYDYTSDCVCNGFFYIRSKPSLHQWLFEVVRWLYDHPYEHDQRAISAFLNYTERVAAAPQEMAPVPIWTAFEEKSAFINFGPWAGDFEELILIHFVDGSAFSLYGRPSWDPSVPAHKRETMKAALASGGSSSQPPLSSSSFSPLLSQPSGVPVASTPMEAFYADDAAVDAEPDQLWDVSPQLRELMQATVRPPPLVRQACGILPQVETAYRGLGFLAEQRQ